MEAKDPSPTSATAPFHRGSLKDEVASKPYSHTPEEQLSKRLSNVLKGCTCPIATGGTVKLESAPSITTKTSIPGSTEQKTFTISPAMEKSGDGYGNGAKSKRLYRQIESLRGLLEDIPKACFGAGSETKCDPSIRDALQLPTNGFTFDSILPAKMDDIKATIVKDLALETDVVLEPYSLNVYQKGGKFVKHKDTPRGEDMLGTLVVCLPSLFTGGGLEVTMGNEKQLYFARKAEYSWGTAEGGCREWWSTHCCKKAANTLVWAAFFADIDHQILEVEDGLRITVAFLIRRKDKWSASSCRPREVNADEQAIIIKEELGTALRDEGFFMCGGKLGYPCLHLYTNTEVFPSGKTSDDPLTAKQVSKLKGRDLMVANAAAGFGLHVFLVPYLRHSCQGDLGDVKLKKFPKKKRCPRYMSEETVESFFQAERRDKEQPDADLWLLKYGDSEQAENKVGETDSKSYLQRVQT